MEENIFRGLKMIKNIYEIRNSLEIGDMVNISELLKWCKGPSQYIEVDGSKNKIQFPKRGKIVAFADNNQYVRLEVVLTNGQKDWFDYFWKDFVWSK